MKKRFIVILQEATEENNNKFKEFITQKGLGWWHWLPNSWLLTNSGGNLSTSNIRDAIIESYGKINNIVIELRADGEDTWSGFGPQTKDKNMFTWIHQNWKR